VSKALDRALAFLERACAELGMGFEDDGVSDDPLLSEDEDRP
jgi:hypothetical protein